MNKKSPLRILEQRMHGGVGKGNLGVFAARHGVGKTACLIHVGVDNLLQGKKVLHLSFYDKPDHVLSWYESIFSELAKAYHLESVSDIHDDIARHRLILNYKNDTLELPKLKERILKTLKDMGFTPEVLIIDGYDFEHHAEEGLAQFNALSKELMTEGWFSLVLHRSDIISHQDKLPQAIQKVLPSVSTVIYLDSHDKSILLKILYEHGLQVADDSHLRLNATTFLMAEE